MVKKKKIAKKKSRKKPVRKAESRRAGVQRKTTETAISCEIKVNGTGKFKVKTQVPFLTHMLEQLFKHSNMNGDINARGDIYVDAHHTTEDIGIVIGETLANALGDKKGIRRFGSAEGVLDEALVRVVLDLSGRPFLDYNLDLKKKRVGNFDTELVEEFFHGLTRGGRFTVHVDQIKGKNTHHIVEAAFKGLAIALKQAVAVEGSSDWSTKKTKKKVKRK